MTGEPSTHVQQSLQDTMAFRKNWRAYQSRLLEHFNRYLHNKRLHLVAAPGSGKTVIGLEVIRRLNQPTLVLAPPSRFAISGLTVWLVSSCPRILAGPYGSPQNLRSQPC